MTFLRVKKNRKAKVADTADYFVTRLFSGSMTEEEEKAITAWCASDELNRREFDRALAIWSEVDALEQDSDLVALCNEPLKSTPAERLVSRWPQFAIAASLFCAVLLFQVVEKEQPDEDVLTRYATAVGEQKVVELSDGSLVTLNTNSQLIVDFSHNNRRTVLDYGEAFFDVAPNPARPFNVELGQRAITVLGTKFNVKKIRGGEVKVAVMEGEVAIHRKEDKVSKSAPLLSIQKSEQAQSLPAPDQYRIKGGSVVVLKEADYAMSAWLPSDIDNIQSWRQGVVRFDSQPLANVVKEINRYTEKKILVEDVSAMALEVNAVLRLDRLDSILDGLERTLPIEVTRHTDHVVIAMRKN